ncbi:hypothetical protein LSH36_300g05076 [Paralvinella palmiformis]|uniref:Uncharacterized protein n=1 Tax=Paralvinella palmiformis TaxID=53620 RepID=A0AAD9N161_9ANNE|nr:hypothetical protein LSH36_300g05076 [Paralvinella palmiformis]
MYHALIIHKTWQKRAVVKTIDCRDIVPTNFYISDPTASKPLKCIFLVYCMLPTNWNGSLKIYYRIIRPFFLKHQKKVDDALDKAATTAQEVMDEVESTAKDAAADTVRRQYVDNKSD